jgi:sterol 3beta-glucosyltransferase
MRTAVLGLRPRSRWHAWRAAHITPPLTLYGFSEQLCPRPNDWPVSRVVCGTWLLPAPPEFTPPPELVQFLAAGPPPVYIGFGSILAGRDPAGLVYQLLAALAQAGQRGIIYRGAWGDLAVGDLPPQVMRCAEVPHAWLFPQVAAVVTHGGAGTVAAALAAGVPPIVVAAFGDQHLWGQRVAALGAGPPPLRRDTLTASTLAAAIRTATETITLRTTATALGAALVAEAGALQAAVQLEQLALPATI